MRTATITSYGALHGPAPTAVPDVEIDLRTALRNPHHDPAMRYKTGLDPQVRDHVLATPGAERIIADAASRVLAASDARPVDVQVFCMGGRHRSVAVAEAIATRLREAGAHVAVGHRDIGKPVVQK